VGALKRTQVLGPFASKFRYAGVHGPTFLGGRYSILAMTWSIPRPGIRPIHSRRPIYVEMVKKSSCG